MIAKNPPLTTTAKQWTKAAAHIATDFRDRITDLVFPPSCLLCSVPLHTWPRDRRALLCSDCVSEFNYGGAGCCDVCAAPLQKIGEANANCLYCRERRYRFHATTALGIYRGPLREAVLRMKQSFHEPLMTAVGQELAEKVVASETTPRPHLVVPTPMYWWKRLLRGTNSPDLLAEAIAQRLQIPVFPRLLRVRRWALKQGTLLPGERMKNVRGAFRVAARYDIAEKHVLLVDDVMTTGATASEAAKVLRRAGAARVSVAVVARGVGLDEVKS